MSLAIDSLSFEGAGLHAAYARGLAPEEVMREVVRRIVRVDDPGIFLHLAETEDLVSAVRALPPFDPVAYPLWGLPFAVKDNIDVAHMPTTAGCPQFAYTPDNDAFVVARLRAAGAVPVGKTNLDQFATGLVGMRTPYPVPKNAVDPEIVPGGSSSGSAVSVAHGIVSFALGTDTAGSGRVPAALNNIVGLKPSLGLLSASGVVPACRTLDTVSLFAPTVAGASDAFRVAAGYDPEDAYSKDAALGRPGPIPPQLRIGVPDHGSLRFSGDDVQAQAFEAALSQLEALGATRVEIDFQPFYDVAKMLYEGTWVAERMAVIEPLLEVHSEAVHPVTRAIVSAADRFSAVDTFRGIYRLAELRRHAEAALQGVDLLCVPSIPTFYSVADLGVDPVGPNSDLGTYTNFVNLLDLCGIAVPTGLRTDGRPASVTLLGKTGDDPMIASLADDLHRACDATIGATGMRLQTTAPLHRSPVVSSETVVAVVGAHMSGLPLNSELTDRDARFLETTTTAPEYRLYALPGGPPARPGLIRTSDGTSVALELWAMPTARFGDFVAGVPAPLCIGSVELADGRRVKGFLVEPAGLDGAEDISGFGGWRAFLNSQ